MKTRRCHHDVHHSAIRFYCLRAKPTLCWVGSGGQPLGPPPPAAVPGHCPHGVTWPAAGRPSADLLWVNADGSAVLLSTSGRKAKPSYLWRQGKRTRLLEGPRSGAENLDAEVHWRRTSGGANAGRRLISDSLTSLLSQNDHVRAWGCTYFSLLPWVTSATRSHLSSAGTEGVWAPHSENENPPWAPQAPTTVNTHYIQNTYTV